ncbi:MAG: protease modulator HflK, partial [Burkholderiaceae bacterium]
MNFNLRTIEWTGLTQRFKTAALGMFNLNDSKWGRDDDKSNGEATDTKLPPSSSDTDKPAAPLQNNSNKPNKPNAGPPDLDELWRDFNQK